MLTKRVQVLFPEDIWEQLTGYAETRKQSVGSLIREAVERTYFTESGDGVQAMRAKLVQNLAEMNLPVADWEEMERQSIDE